MSSSPEERPRRLVVPLAWRGLRLDRFLASALAGEAEAPSRAELQRWIGQGLVKIGARQARAADRLREGDEIWVTQAPPRVTTALPDASVVFRVLHVDPAIVVIDKPAGLVVHPARGHASGTLVNGLLAAGYFDALREPSRGAVAQGEGGDEDGDEESDHVRPGVVHRLDKDTSGVMVVARTAEARERLKVQFAAHTIDREYEAIAEGAVGDMTLATLHGRHPSVRTRFSSRVATGKRAVTHVRVLRAFARGLATHVACRLETGRTHQIRVHLADAGHPLLGDTLYGRVSKNVHLARICSALGRQALHARRLGFVHPTSGERVVFEAEPPEDFMEALGGLALL